MSAQQELNKALHTRFFEEVINCKNVDALEQLVAPHYKSRTSTTGFPEGRTALKEWICTLLDAFPDVHITVDQQVAEQDRVISDITFRGTQMAQFQGIPPLGQAITLHTMEIARFENGRCVERWDGLNATNLADHLGAVYPPRRHSLPVPAREIGKTREQGIQS